VPDTRRNNLLMGLHYAARARSVSLKDPDDKSNTSALVGVHDFKRHIRFTDCSARNKAKFFQLWSVLSNRIRASILSANNPDQLSN
jgi:hypothetical protein